MLKWFWLCLLSYSSVSFAGGSYSLALIDGIEGAYPKVNITVVFLDKRWPYAQCEKTVIKLNYGYVPWYSRFGFGDTSHPSPKDTKEALVFLNDHYQKQQPVNIGPMGGGLKRTELLCVYISKGLKLYNKPDGVMSFYLPV